VTALAALHVRPGREDEFLAAYARARVLDHALRFGMYQAQLLRPNGGGDFVVVSTWPSDQSYAVWGASDDDKQLSGLLEPLVESEPTSRTFTVAARAACR
jgi:heme-degrading monooxygenase HmoA